MTIDKTSSKPYFPKNILSTKYTFPILNNRNLHTRRPNFVVNPCISILAWITFYRDFGMNDFVPTLVCTSQNIEKVLFRGIKIA